MDISGTDGDDRFVNRIGNDYASGNGGLDAIFYSGPRPDYVADIWTNNYIDGLNVGISGPLGEMDSLQDVERAFFSDGRAMAFDLGYGSSAAGAWLGSGSAGDAFRLYEGALGRAPDLAGLGYWIAQLDAGARLVDVARAFLATEESREVFGDTPTNAQFVETVYWNVLHREADVGGHAFWSGLLETGRFAREEVLLRITESAEKGWSGSGDDPAIIGPPIEYIPWL